MNPSTMRRIEGLVWIILGCWMAWASYCIEGLERRVNLVEAGQHWQEEPPARDSAAQGRE